MKNHKMNLKSIIVLLNFLLINTFLFAQNTLLFKITGKDLKQPSYVFGTMHVNDEKAFNFGDAVFDAIDACEIAAFEIDMSSTNAEEMKRQLQKDTIFTNLIDYIKLELPKQFDSTFDKNALVFKILSAIPNLKNKLNNTDTTYSERTQHVDAFLESYAMHNGKTIHGIESITEQLHILLDFDKDVIVKGIADFIKRPDWDSLIYDYLDNIEILKSRYASLNLDNVCSEFYDANYPVDFLEKLLDKRNVNMVDRILPMMKNKPVFMAIGAGHLCGKKGILSLLKNKGYTITPIDITTKNVQPVTFTWIKNELKDAGIIIETANVKLSKVEIGKHYLASDTTRKGLIHFELLNDYETDLLNFEEWSNEDEESYDNEYSENIDIEPIEEEVIDTSMASNNDNDELIEPTEKENEEIEYGDDSVYDTEFEGELNVPEQTNDSTLALMKLMKENLLSLRQVEKVDTLWVDGKIGKIEVLKSTLAGKISYTAKIDAKKGDNKFWFLTITGDPLLLNNEAIMRYFTSFAFL